jgi:uridine kinase
MPEKEIKIVVLGKVASGKSTITRLIKNALEQHGFTNIEYNAELDDLHPGRDQDNKVAALKEIVSISIYEDVALITPIQNSSSCTQQY